MRGEGGAGPDDDGTGEIARSDAFDAGRGGVGSDESAIRPGAEASDLALLDAVRSGSLAAFAVLYERHRPAAVRAAGMYLAARHRSLAEDVVEVAFSSVYSAIQRGGGPVGPFRAYLLVSVRREAARVSRRRDQEPLVAADSAVTHAPPTADASPFGGPSMPGAVRGEEHLDPELLLSKAFGSLNPRYRHVLWLTEVEGRSADELGPLLDLTSNAVAALTYRSRLALRSSYFRTYGASLAPAACAPLVPLLAAYVEAGRPLDGHDEIRAHLAGCSRCRDVAKGAARATEGLAALAPAGALGVAAWLDRDPGRNRLRRQRSRTVVAAGLVVALAAIVAAWPSDGPRPGRPRRADLPARSAPTNPSPSPSSSRSVPVAEVPGAVGIVSAEAGERPDPKAMGAAQFDVRVLADGPDGGLEDPVPGVLVALVDQRSGAQQRSTTSTAGRARFAGLAPGRYRATGTAPVGLALGPVAVPPGRDPAHRRRLDLGDITVRAGRTTVEDVQLVPWRQLAISGRRSSSLASSPRAPRVPRTEAGPTREVSWEVAVASRGGGTSGVRVDAVMTVPVGVGVVAAELRPSTGVEARCGSPLAADSVREVRVSCTVRHLEGAVELQLRVWIRRDGRGSLEPSFRADADGWAIAGRGRGDRVVVGPA